MTDAPINLNKFRKARNRTEAKNTAEQNATKFGRTKAERLLEATKNQRARIMLDQHRLNEDQ